MYNYNVQLFKLLFLFQSKGCSFKQYVLHVKETCQSGVFNKEGVFNNTPSYQNKDKYRKLRNSVNKDIRNAKREYKCKLAAKIKNDRK